MQHFNHQLLAAGLLALVGLLLPFSVSAASDARTIMQMSNDRDDGDNRSSDMTMTLIDKNGKKRVRKIQSYDKDKGKDRRRLTFFLSPADVKDTAFLTYDYDDDAKDDDQWLYLPALRKTKRIASSDKSGSFMGSDFNYSDMTRRNLEASDFKLLKEQEVRGRKAWLIEAVPKTPQEIDKTGYKKSVYFIDQESHVILRAVHWTDEGNKLKYLDTPGLEKIDGIWTITHMTMTTKKGKSTLHKTELSFSNIQYNQALGEEMFTVRQLEKGV